MVPWSGEAGLDLAGYQARNEEPLINVGGHRCGGDYPIVSFLYPHDSWLTWFKYPDSISLITRW